MAEFVEVAIEAALLGHLAAYSSSPAVPVAYPNKVFVSPSPVNRDACYLAANLLWTPTLALGIPYGSDNLLQGLLQVSVFWGLDAGAAPPGRLAAAMIDWFQRGTTLTSDSFTVRIERPPYRGSLLRNDPWIMIPVTVPFQAFAP